MQKPNFLNINNPSLHLETYVTADTLVFGVGDSFFISQVQTEEYYNPKPRCKDFKLVKVSNAFVSSKSKAMELATTGASKRYVFDSEDCIEVSNPRPSDLIFKDGFALLIVAISGDECKVFNIKSNSLQIIATPKFASRMKNI